MAMNRFCPFLRNHRRLPPPASRLPPSACCAPCVPCCSARYAAVRILPATYLHRSKLCGPPSQSINPVNQPILHSHTLPIHHGALMPSAFPSHLDDPSFPSLFSSSLFHRGCFYTTTLPFPLQNNIRDTIRIVIKLISPLPLARKAYEATQARCQA